MAVELLVLRVRPSAQGTIATVHTCVVKKDQGKDGFDNSVAYVIGGCMLSHLLCLQNNKKNPAREKKIDDRTREMITRLCRAVR